VVKSALATAGFSHIVKAMSARSHNQPERLIASLTRLWPDPLERALLANAIHALDSRYALSRKIAREPGVAEIIQQLFGRLAHAFGGLSGIQGKSILDIACGSNTSKAPASLYVDTPFGALTIGRAGQGYTALFEPWFCRTVLALGAAPVGVDFGDLEGEAFTHYRVDLGQIGALDFLPSHSFDAVQDSRLFGSPEFTAQFPDPAGRLKVAQEIVRQEHRLLKAGGVVIHSDASALLR
jgi:SAM-dependent methyltransferase